MSTVGRARRIAELVGLRLALPRRLARESLDGLLASLTPQRPPRGDRVEEFIRRDIRLTEWGVARLPWVANTCLYRSLARYAVLRRSGANAAFVMGLGPGGVTDDGHAWVELDDEPFEEHADVSHYTVTFRYPFSFAGRHPEAL